MKKPYRKFCKRAVSRKLKAPANYKQALPTHLSRWQGLLFLSKTVYSVAFIFVPLSILLNMYNCLTVALSSTLPQFGHSAQQHKPHIVILNKVKKLSSISGLFDKLRVTTRCPPAYRTRNVCGRQELPYGKYFIGSQALPC